MKKTLISKRFFTNLMIVLFGVVVLMATLALTFQSWFPNADVLNFGSYEIKEGYLYVYESKTVKSAFTQNGITVTDENAELISNLKKPITYYAKISIVNNGYLINGAAYSNSPTEKLMTYALAQAREANDGDGVSTINRALYRYRQAKIYAGLNYRIEGDILYSRSMTSTYESYKKSGVVPDKNVRIATYPNSKPDSVWGTQSLAVNTKSVTKYIEPQSSSIALSLLQNALSSATNAETADNSLLKDAEAPKDLPLTYFSQDKGILNAAIKNYKSQIASASSGKALTLSSTDTVKFGETVNISYSADYQKLITAAKGSATSFELKINNIKVCNVNPSSNSLDTICSWDNSSHQGTYSLGPDVGTATEKISTGFSGPKMIEFVAMGAQGEIDKARKTITVGLQPGDSTTAPSGSLGISITAPNSVDKSNIEAAKSVSVKISASNLDKKASFLSWYVCNAPASQVPADSSGCELKQGKDIYVNSLDSVSEQRTWDASGTPASTKSIMVKAFSPDTDGKGNNLYIAGSKAFSNNITVVDTDPGGTGGDGTGGGSGGGTVDEGGTSLSNWIANFKSAKNIKSIQDLLPKVGSFTLLILAALAVIAIIIAGLRYITSGGDPKGAEAGKKALLFAVYGIVLAVLCVTLVRITYNEAVKIFTAQPGGPTSTSSVLSGNAGTAANGPTLNLTDLFGQDTGVVWQIVRLLIYWAETVAVFFILYASFLYMTAYGDDSKAEAAKKTLIWAIIGLAFILGASYLLQVFTGIIV